MQTRILLRHAEYSCRMFDFAAKYEALQRRDPTPDGVVFVAVKTTGIYCRPVCRARIPFARNVEFYPSAIPSDRFSRVLFWTNSGPIEGGNRVELAQTEKHR
jgi:hypothetical protein